MVVLYFQRQKYWLSTQWEKDLLISVTIQGLPGKEGQAGSKGVPGTPVSPAAVL